ncbi:hypothetical protein J437_LFUL011254 [Ladona fulva]|uniref:Major facilitator superfamily (MFS) profile domain-containing protein n=1 Tax=Ladona fulva TaxID=123851 RepID=A0A8K0KF20_LADFU|nr:hypothetical protein J437_LFUL011254 [Ladona fulva]
MNFDDVLDAVDGFGRYQKGLAFVFLPVMFAYTTIYCGQIFFAHTPQHWCRVPSLAHLPQDVRRALSIPNEGEGGERWSQCTMYDANYTMEIDMNDTRLAPIVPCKFGWEYDLNSTFPTMVSDMDWVCGESWRPVFGQASFFVGATIGSVILGAVADQWGRVPSLVIANAISAAAGIAIAYIPTSSGISDSSYSQYNDTSSHDSPAEMDGDTMFTPFTLFVILRFVTGMGYDACYMMAYICILEYVDTKRRAVMANIPLAVFLTLAFVTMPWVAYAVWDWRLFSIIICIPVVSIIFAPFVVPESCRWLLSKGKYSRAEKILKKVAKVNGKTLTKDFNENLREMGMNLAEEAKMNSATTIDLFRTPSMRKRVLLMLILWLILTIVYDGHIRNVENLGENIFITFSVTGIVEAPACMLPAYTLDRFGRRSSFGIPLALSGVSYLIVLALPRESTIGITALAVIGRLCVVTALNSCLQFFVELLPTRLRGQGTSFVHVAGHMASLLSPLIIHLAEVNYYLPFLILGLMGVLGGGFAFLLPETARQPLPETVEDVENWVSPTRRPNSKHSEAIYRLTSTEPYPVKCSVKMDSNTEQSVL